MKLRAKLLRVIDEPGLFLLLIAACYVVAYLIHPAAPGNNSAHPEGWWGWFDQGNYLKAAHAFANFDFTPAQHFYPPLYPLLGGLFLGISKTHAFWLIDLVCLLWFAWTFIFFARRYIPQRLAVMLFLITIVLNPTLFENFVIPWTTTLSLALLSVGIHSLGRFADSNTGARPGASELACCSLAIGLIAVVRPVDALVGGSLWLGVMGYAWRSCSIEGRQFWRRSLLALMALSVGMLLFLSFNQRVFGSPLGGYVQASSVNGYFLADAAEKFTSLFLDGYTLYLEPKSGMLDHYPWLALALPALIFVLIRGDWALRVVGAAVVLQFVLYLPYGDLLPNGLWRFLNIHYFKWTFPYLALFACYAVLGIVHSFKVDRVRAVAWSIFFAVAALLLASLRVAVTRQPLAIHLGGDNISAIELDIDAGGHGIDFDLVDLAGLSGGFTSIYFGEHSLKLDGRELARIKEYRVLPAPWGVRILFVRPVHGQSLIFRPDQKLTLGQTILSASSGSYHFIIGQPKPFWSEANAIPTPEP